MIRIGEISGISVDQMEPIIPDYDVLSLLPKRNIECLDDGFVRLVDCMPRLCPVGRTCEFAVVRAARVSYGLGLKTIAEDDRLIRYLIRHRHTSPLEQVKFTFHLRCPRFVAVHMLKHRTANINEFSQRYSEIEDDAFYHPTASMDNGPSGGGVRYKSEKNKQSSVGGFSDSTATGKFRETEESLRLIFGKYHAMIKDGVAPECARFCLPNATYTEMYFTLDLSNLLKFFSLRMDKGAQAETTVFATAMFNLIKPLVPVVIDVFEDTSLNSIILSGIEITAIRSGTVPAFSSKSEEVEFREKMGMLGLQLP